MGAGTAYAIPIAARFMGDNDFEPGPFNLGKWSFPVACISILWMAFMGTVFLFPTSPTTDVADMNYTVVRPRFFLSSGGIDTEGPIALVGRPRRCHGAVSGLVLLPGVRRSPLVHWANPDDRKDCSRSGRVWKTVDVGFCGEEEDRDSC